jgi:beta-1,4-mannosyl-glycoprotein beta-1,4-N-acetylglucosaminyltransferase
MMVIDCFTFNGEYDLLEARIEYLQDVVDYFVIVEADITFSGKPRQFLYPNDISRFRQYADKIIYSPCSIDTTGLNFDAPVVKFDPSSAPWQVEKAQRNHMLNPLSVFAPTDIVIINDVDEFPSKDAIRVAINHMSGAIPKLVCDQKMFYYNFNKVQDDPWFGSVITTVKHVRELTPEGIRDTRNKLTSISNGGWHLSNWMTAEQIQEKIKAFSHQEYNNERFNTIEAITKNMKEGRDFLGREFNTFSDFDVDTLPTDFKTVITKYTK